MAEQGEQDEPDAPPKPPKPASAAAPTMLDKNKDTDESNKYKQQYLESQHREKILIRRLAAKEQEIQDYVAQITELKSAQVNSTPGSARSCMLDPAVNLLVTRLKQELTRTRNHLEETQNEFSAWKFTPDSNTGKKLMAKCRLLHQENEDLGKMATSGRIAKLEGDLALQKNFSEEAKKSQSELEDFLQELDEDVEGMQSTIVLLQQELRVARDKIEVLSTENALLRSYKEQHGPLTNGSSTVIATDSVSKLNSTRTCSDDEVRTKHSDSYNTMNGRTSVVKSVDSLVESNSSSSKRRYASDSSDNDNDNDGDNDTNTKKQRRGSVLSLDYNEEEEPLTAPNGEAN